MIGTTAGGNCRCGEAGRGFLELRIHSGAGTEAVSRAGAGRARHTLVPRGVSARGLARRKAVEALGADAPGLGAASGPTSASDLPVGGRVQGGGALPLQMSSYTSVQEQLEGSLGEIPIARDAETRTHAVAHRDEHLAKLFLDGLS